MTLMTASIEFFKGIPEDLTNVSLRRGKDSGNKIVLMTFDTLKAIEKLNSFTGRSHGNLLLLDTEGEINIEISQLKFIYGGFEGDELQRVECSFEIDNDDHWQRFMRFMNRYAEANGMEYADK